MLGRIAQAAQLPKFNRKFKNIGESPGLLFLSKDIVREYDGVPSLTRSSVREASETSSFDPTISATVWSYTSPSYSPSPASAKSSWPNSVGSSFRLTMLRLDVTGAIGYLNIPYSSSSVGNLDHDRLLTEKFPKNLTKLPHVGQGRGCVTASVLYGSYVDRRKALALQKAWTLECSMRSLYSR
ncbi:uncharacterized protein BDZ83DRAFT_653812 [Colletotrichum acutatum]|uniref:Uncharacterized protein n=1 Tax=Glomerella acutata TaxID=27357 RepID=A0AAD8UIY4_GLOAC|nr:uncharacterized protein BDZ83DRAFT_653812 [Colletotrichum acutatum]KAK1722584.1 hypothetical protein BDZ83DRAFT_653812 [Colletotrichum acutatum]